MLENMVVFVYWLMLAFSVYLGLGILAVLLLFGVAKYKGWLRPDITPIEIIERLRQERTSHD
jgi:hypothetical protein